MSKTKRWLIVALVCLNVALIGGVVLVASAPEAEAQIIGAGTDYMVVTAAIGSDYDAVYVLDLSKMALGAWKLDKTSKKLVPLGVRGLAEDFPKRR